LIAFPRPAPQTCAGRSNPESIGPDEDRCPAIAATTIPSSRFANLAIALYYYVALMLTTQHSFWMAYRAYVEIATRKGSNFSSDSQRSEIIPDETLVCDFLNAFV
jgi:hypothetical protein